MAHGGQVNSSSEDAVLGRRILALRNRLSMSQTGFARELGGGVTQQIVSDWEHGRRLRQIKTAWQLIRLFEKHGIIEPSGAGATDVA